MNLKKFTFMLTIVCISMSVSAQKHPVIRLEVSAPSITSGGSKNFEILFPTIYASIGKHLEIGLSVNSTSPILKEDNYGYDARFTFPSIHINYNLLKSHRRIIPCFGVNFSRVKGKYTDMGFANDPTYSSLDRQRVKEAVESSEFALGYHAGLDYNLSTLLSLFAKVRMFGGDLGKNWSPFSYGNIVGDQIYIETYTPIYIMVGVIFKFYKGKKEMIK